MAAKNHDRLILHMIAIWKVMKTVAMIAIATGAAKLVGKPVAPTLVHWLAVVGLDEQNRVVRHWLIRVGPATNRELVALSIAATVYAGIFATQAIGIWMDRRWAEIFTVVISASFIPFELYELARVPSLLHVMVLFLNVAAAVWLTLRLLRIRRARRLAVSSVEASTPASTPASTTTSPSASTTTVKSEPAPVVRQ